jgi:hypothetical protein
LDFSRYVSGLLLRPKSSDNLTLAIDEKLCEVPFDTLGSHNAFHGGLQMLVQRMGPVTIDFNLLE